MTASLKYIVVWVLLASVLVLQVDAQTACKSKVEGYILRLKGALQNFIPDPGSDAARDQYLQSLRQINPGLYDKVRRLSLEAKEKMDEDASWLACFQQEFLNIQPSDKDENMILWSSHLFKRFVTMDYISPEFERGIGVHVDINQGAADLGKSTEAYSFAGRLLLSYTFSKERTGTGGTVRLMGGISTYYYDSEFNFFANPRVEYRIKDLGNKLTTFGNLKVIIDGNFGETWIAGAGIGVELHNFGVQVLYQRQGKVKNSHLLVGLFYRFLK